MFFTFVGESLKWSINQEMCYFLHFMIVGNKWSKTMLGTLSKLSEIDLLITCCNMQSSFITVIVMNTCDAY